MLGLSRFQTNSTFNLWTVGNSDKSSFQTLSAQFYSSINFELFKVTASSLKMWTNYKSKLKVNCHCDGVATFIELLRPSSL